MLLFMLLEQTTAIFNFERWEDMLTIVSINLSLFRRNVFLRSYSFVAASGSVAGHLLGEDGGELGEEPGLEHAIGVDLAALFFVLGKGLFHAVFGIELRIAAAVDVIKHFQRNLDILDFWPKFIDFLQIFYNLLQFLKTKYILALFKTD